MCAVVRPSADVIGVVVVRESIAPSDDAQLQREVELAYELADESLGRPAGLTRPGG